MMSSRDKEGVDDSSDCRGVDDCPSSWWLAPPLVLRLAASALLPMLRIILTSIVEAFIVVNCFVVFLKLENMSRAMMLVSTASKLSIPWASDLKI